MALLVRDVAKATGATGIVVHASQPIGAMGGRGREGVTNSALPGGSLTLVVETSTSAAFMPHGPGGFAACARNCDTAVAVCPSDPVNSPKKA
jgi:hypothetical protein